MSLSTASVVEAATRLVDSEGESGLGWNRLARELGVKPPSLYNHVADAGALRRQVAIAGWQRYAEQGKVAVGRRRGERALRALADAYVELSRGSPGLFAVMSTTRLAPTEPDFQETSRALAALFFRPLADLGVAPDDSWHVLRAFRAAIHGFVWLEIQGQFASPEDTSVSFERLLTIFFRGLSS